MGERGTCFLLSSRLRKGPGVGKARLLRQYPNMPNWHPRNTKRARTLRREAAPAEHALWEHLSRSQQGAKFSRQMPVGPYYADFLCRELKLVVEADGHSHDVTPERDEARDQWMQAEGYTVLRFTNSQVHDNIEGVVTAIRLKIEELRCS